MQHHITAACICLTEVGKEKQGNRNKTTSNNHKLFSASTSTQVSFGTDLFRKTCTVLDQCYWSVMLGVSALQTLLLGWTGKRKSEQIEALEPLCHCTGCVTLITFLQQHQQDCAMSLAIGVLKSSARFHHIESGLTESNPKASCLPPHLGCSRWREDKWKSSLGTAAPQSNKWLFIKKELCRIRTSFADGLNTPRIFSVASKTIIQVQNPHHFP